MNISKQIILVSATKMEAQFLYETLLPKHRVTWNREDKFLYFTSQLSEEYVLVFVVTGMGLSRAYQGLKQALSMFQHVDCVVGYGLAGGLIKIAKRGDLVVPKTVQTRESKWIPLLSLKPFISTKKEHWNKLLSVDHVISSPIDKAGAYAATGMDAVDMESGSWAKVCVESNIASWAMVRSVVDGGEDELPNMIKIVNEYGDVNLLKAIVHFLFHPSHIGVAMSMTPNKLKEIMGETIEVVQLFLQSKGQEQRADHLRRIGK